MIKKLLLISGILLSASASFAQSDTLLFENFDTDPVANYALFNSGNDTVWVNFDADALPDANGRPQDWFWFDGWVSSVDSLDACLGSSSWLTNFLPGNRNWLMTPPLFIADASAELSWSSAPRQTPRYLDGYSVLVSTTDNFEASFTDTIFQAGQFLTGTGADYSTYTFSPGFVHGMDGTYIQFDPSADSSRFIGELRPFSVSLAQYSGQTIYITFLHDSDDDNLIAIDDILVTGTLVGLNESAGTAGLTVSPNPAIDKIELSYLLPAAAPLVAEIYDLKGSLVLSVSKGIQLAGSQKLALDITDLDSGAYTVVLKASGSSATAKFVKE